MSAKKQYQELVNRLVTTHRAEVKVSKMYGMSVMTTRGQAFIGFSHDDLVVRLDGLALAKASGLKGSTPYVMSNGQLLPGWIRVPVLHVSHWRGFAEEARAYANENAQDGTPA
jgi:hypothetical protein